MIKKKHDVDATPLVRFQRGMILPADQVARLEAFRALEAELSAQRESAEARGYADGLRQGLEDSFEVLREAEASARRRVEDSRGDILALALKLAERILGQFVSIQPEVLERLLSELLEGLPDRDTVEILAGPKAFEVLSGGELGPRIQQDDEAAPWSLRLMSKAGVVDAGFETQLANIERQLKR